MLELSGLGEIVFQCNPNLNMTQQEFSNLGASMAQVQVLVYLGQENTSGSNLLTMGQPASDQIITKQAYFSSTKCD